MTSQLNQDLNRAIGYLQALKQVREWQINPSVISMQKFNVVIQMAIDLIEPYSHSQEVHES